ncbi:MAG: ATP-binding cassette domain-containing protein [Candidatus Chisholmbacteria bacterium]|nr:ATP-binding cassette domain-containing protein [Candidatus Chisholmbacteria bacterium]
MIIFDQVTKIFPNGDKAIDEVSFRIEPQELVLVTGPSGAGKTTLLRLMLREILPTKGVVVVDNEDVTKLPVKKVPQLRRRIGAAWQDFKLLRDRTVAENIAVGLQILGHAEDEIKGHVEQMLELVGLKGKGELFPAQISGGELQRTVIARALATKPKILFADEPTGNLDDQTAQQIIKLLEEINDLGTTVLIATHDRNIVDELRARTLILEKGKLVEDRGKGGKK